MGEPSKDCALDRRNMVEFNECDACDGNLDYRRHARARTVHMQERVTCVTRAVRGSCTPLHHGFDLSNGCGKLTRLKINFRRARKKIDLDRNALSFQSLFACWSFCGSANQEYTLRELRVCCVAPPSDAGAKQIGGWVCRVGRTVVLAASRTVGQSAGLCSCRTLPGTKKPHQLFGTNNYARP
jgi:hypothetical protein